ncbi:MAG: dihydrodipicolinate synthase family protein [Actinobacteria bacterium]|nr:MAG: dihydrodipicolinate synthase family protein [Actinomycetota bacterium]REK39959.1 MAG: dihydrodipicolinate synthase family protein [Actinomycetota bacterium]
MPPPEYMPALVTPFTRGGALDIKAFRHNVRLLAETGMSGFVIGGSNGEGPYLEPGERLQLVKSVRRRKAHLMVGIAGESTRMALQQASEAEEGKADSILVMTPTTAARGRDDAVVGHYKTIADASALPVFLYSVPPVTAYSLPVELVAKLARHPNIVGMKDSSGDVVRLQSIIDATPADFVLYSGSSKALTAAMAVGCHGAITGSGNYLPNLVQDVLRKAREDPSSARRLQRKLSSISGEVEALGVPGVKAASRAAGLEPGHPRLPLTRLSRGHETSIAKLIT